MSYEGSPQEKQARVFLSELSIDYDKLSKEEFVSLIGILEKSKLLRNRTSRRGKARASMTRGYGKRKKKEAQATKSSGMRSPI